MPRAGGGPGAEEETASPREVETNGGRARRPAAQAPRAARDSPATVTALASPQLYGRAESWWNEPVGADQCPCGILRNAGETRRLHRGWFVHLGSALIAARFPGARGGFVLVARIPYGFFDPPKLRFAALVGDGK